jgi:hypothetical protein
MGMLVNDHVHTHRVSVDILSHQGKTKCIHLAVVEHQPHLNQHRFLMINLLLLRQISPHSSRQRIAQLGLRQHPLQQGCQAHLNQLRLLLINQYSLQHISLHSSPQLIDQLALRLFHLQPKGQAHSSQQICSVYLLESIDVLR